MRHIVFVFGYVVSTSHSNWKYSTWPRLWTEANIGFDLVTFHKILKLLRRIWFDFFYGYKLQRKELEWTRKSNYQVCYLLQSSWFTSWLFPLFFFRNNLHVLLLFLQHTKQIWSKEKYANFQNINKFPGRRVTNKLFTIFYHRKASA